MPWAPEHKDHTRAKILHSAARLFSHQGFQRVSINQVMADAGLTRGAFYKHFASKAELYSEALIHGAHERANRHLQESIDLKQVVERYLCGEHVFSQDDVCPLAFLVSDITQCEPLQQQTYRKVLQGFIRLLQQESAGGEAQAILSSVLMIGGVALARAAGEGGLSEQILQLSQAEALRQLGCADEITP